MITSTRIISVRILPYLVKILLIKDNQLVTKNRKSYLVGTSETIRASSYDEKENLFNEWLSGLIDGDGCFLVSKKGYTSCEITMSLEDESALRKIQNKLGGSVKLRSGSKSVRYRLHNKQDMIDLINRVNGKIRHTTRLKQLNLVCVNLDIPFFSPDNLHDKHGWFSGFFDADGTISLSLKGKYLQPQLTISVTNKLMMDVSYFKTNFRGNIYYDKSQNGYYKWCIQGKEDILRFLGYIQHCPSHSIKRKRLLLVDQYYYLKDIRAYKEDNKIKFKVWIQFIKNW